MLIGINGLEGSGKDTVYEIIKNWYPDITEQWPFAKPVKIAAATFLGGIVTTEMINAWKNDPDIRIVVEHRKQPHIHISDISVRDFIRLIGHDGRRIFGEDIWVDLNIGRQPRNFHWNRIIMVTDVRYDNEAEAVRGRGGFIVQVLRPGIERADHGSEAGIHSSLIDYTINNDKGLEELELAVKTLLHDIQSGHPDRHSTSIPELH